MTPEAINRAIAELCGWTRTWDPAFRQWVQRSPDGLNVICDPDPGSGWETSRLPNYYKSLDACAEFERTLECTDLNGPDKATEYRVILEYLTCREMLGAIRATAPQRCEAFLRLHNRWEEA